MYLHCLCLVIDAYTSFKYCLSTTQWQSERSKVTLRRVSILDADQNDNSLCKLWDCRKERTRIYSVLETTVAKMEGSNTCNQYNRVWILTDYLIACLWNGSLLHAYRKIISYIFAFFYWLALYKFIKLQFSHHYFCFSAKRSRHVADNHRTSGGKEVEHTLFHAMVQKAGLHVYTGQTQDKLGEFQKLFIDYLHSCQKMPDTSPWESIHHDKNMLILWW